MIDNIIKNFPLLLLISAVTLSLGFNFGTFGGGKAIELRMEDFLIVVLGLIFILDVVFLKRGKIGKPPLFFYIIFWLIIGIVSVLSNLIFGRLAVDKALFYYFKQVEFFIFFFYVFYQIKDIKSAKFSVKTLIFFGLVNALYVVYQVITGNRMGEYGTAAIAERGVYPTGAFFMFFSIISVNLFLHYYYYFKGSFLKKLVFGFILMTPILGVFGSDSKTNFLIFIAAMALTIFLLFLKRKNFKLLITTIFVFIFSILAFLLVQKYVPFAYRLLHVLSFEGLSSGFINGRWIFIVKVIKEILQFPSMIFLGFGPGYVGEAHNQFLRNYIEVGLLGSIFFFLIIFSIIKISLKAFLRSQDKFLTAVSAGLLICTTANIGLAFVTDSFIAVKPSEVYWIFAAIALATIKLMAPKENNVLNILSKTNTKNKSPQKNNICAIIVSHTPDQDFMDNVKILTEQVGKIVVVNNGSSNLDQAFANQDGENKTVLISNKTNLGQGKALSQGMEWCIKNNYSWVLLLDQDSKVDPMMVENQIAAYENFLGEEVAIVGVNCIYKGTNEIKYKIPETGKKYFERDVVMISGMLLSVEAYEKTGKFREEFFIDSIDADYCLRLRKNKFKIIIAYKAMMVQRVGNEGRIKRFLWKKILVTNHSAKRCYYMTRNGLILVKEYLFLEPYWCFRRIIWYFLVKPLFIILYEEDKKNKIKNIIKGIFDALINKQENSNI